MICMCPVCFLWHFLHLQEFVGAGAVAFTFWAYPLIAALGIRFAKLGLSCVWRVETPCTATRVIGNWWHLLLLYILHACGCLPLSCRYCLGTALAMAEMKVFLALLARKYQFEADNNTKWKPALGYYPENGLPMVVRAWPSEVSSAM